MRNSGAILAVSIFVLAVFMAAPAAAGLTFESSCPQTIAEGDAFTVHGTGATNGSITLMVIGRHYFNTLKTSPDTLGNFSLTLGPEATRNFSAGQYAFVILDPGANKQYEINTHVSGSGNITVTDRGITVADLGSVSDLSASVQPEVAALFAISERKGVDDIIQAEYFFVELPALRFNQRSDPVTGRLILDRNNSHRIVFSGITNMAPKNRMSARIYNATSGEEISRDTIPTIAPANRTEPGGHTSWNTWHYSLETTLIMPGEYVITVGWEKEPWCGTDSVLFVVPDEGTNSPAHARVKSVLTSETRNLFRTLSRSPNPALKVPGNLPRHGPPQYYF